MKIIRYILRGLEGVLITCGLLFILTKAYGIDFYVVLSGSMEPAIKTGSLVLVDTGETDYRIGDIITFLVDDQLVTHRIVEIAHDICKTKGDANELGDGFPVYKDQILGIVRKSIPGLGYTISFMKSKRIIMLILALLFLSNLVDVLSIYDSHKKERKT